MGGMEWDGALVCVVTYVEGGGRGGDCLTLALVLVLVTHLRDGVHTVSHKWMLAPVGRSQGLDAPQMRVDRPGVTGGGKLQRPYRYRRGGGRERE